MIKINSIASADEEDNRKELFNLYKRNPIPESEQIAQIGLFQKRQDLSKILFLNSLYQLQLNTHGNILEFGTRWGKNLVTFSNLRGIFEPFNYSRKIIGFDTFEGFKNISPEDGTNDIIAENSFSVTESYDEYLNQLLSIHEKESPLSHIKKFDIYKGDAEKTFEHYLENHPESIISLAYFDFDIYKPTKACLKLIEKRLTKGAVIAFDELNDPKFPGESKALQEVFGFKNITLKRNVFSTMQSYFIYGE